MSDRVLAKVVTIDKLIPIEDADRIELALVGGWQVVVQKGLYTEGTKVVYYEIDSLIPLDKPVGQGLEGVSSKLKFEIDNAAYARIKTMKLRKQLSQGYCTPLNVAGVDSKAAVGTDVTKLLGVLKYEKKEESLMNNFGGVSGKASLGFPSFIPKTDQTRIQNISNIYLVAVESKEEFEESFKLDGSSLTAWVKDAASGVASRNVGFRVEDQKRGFFETLKDWFDQYWNQGKAVHRCEWDRVTKADDNPFTQMAIKAGLLEAIKRDGRNLAIQGEMVGPSIQKNFEGVKENEFYCYDVFLIDEQRYMLPSERIKFCTDQGIKHVPINYTGPLKADTVVEAIARADGPSGLNGKYREGFVYKSTTRDFSFKVVSNNYLMKEE